VSQKSKNKKWRSAGLYALLAIVLISLATTFFGTRPAERLEISYSDLMSRVERGEVSKVLVEVTPDGRQIAIADAEINSRATRVQVNLPPSLPTLRTPCLPKE
jgi:cell division protease FtsH